MVDGHCRKISRFVASPTGHLDASNGHSSRAADAAVRAAESLELGVGRCCAGLQCERLDLRAEKIIGDIV